MSADNQNSHVVFPSMNQDRSRQPHISAQYRPDIDGLRAVAVLAVMLCHTGYRQFAGGFIGVDVFFTISGFVVTTSILGDLRAGMFSFKAFYARRAKRLAPALYTMLAASFAFSILFSFPDDTYHLARNIVAVATMTSNIFLSRQTGYFDAKAADQPLLHTWSLSVEEQFYVLLPFILFWVHRKVPKGMTVALLSAAAASLLCAMVAAHSSNPASYYYAQNRAFEFLVGAVIAVPEFRANPLRSKLFDLAFLAGIGIILLGAAGLSSTAQFPGVGAIVPCGGALLAIYGGSRTVLARVILENKIAVYLGKISYPIYLWHWPVYFALRRLDLASWQGYVVGTVVTFVLSSLTYEFIERPVRISMLPARRALLFFLLLPVVGSAALLGVGKISDGYLFAYPPKIQQDVRWSGDSLFDMPRGKKCWSQVSVNDAQACVLGDRDATSKAVLWGDSHAYHLIYFFDRLGQNRHMAIHDVAFTLCPPIENEPPMPGDMTYLVDHQHCVSHDRAVMDYVLSNADVKTVFMAAAWQNYQNLSTAPDAGPNGHGLHPGELESELGKTIARLTAAGRHVVLMNDVPMIPQELINCDFNNDLLFAVHRHVCQFSADIARTQHAPVGAMLRRLKQQYPTIDIIHTYDVPCTTSLCSLDFDGLPIYRYDDYHHLSAAGSSLLFPKYMARHPGELDVILGRNTEPAVSVQHAASAKPD